MKKSVRYQGAILWKFLENCARSLGNYAPLKNYYIKNF